MSDIKFEKCNDKDINDKCEVISVMADEIAELREALGLIVYADEMINEGVNAHGGMSMMIGSIANARELLDKHK